MSRNRTYKIVLFTLILLGIDMAMVGLCAAFHADAAYANALSNLGIAIAGGGGLGAGFQAMRHGFGAGKSVDPPVAVEGQET